MNNEDTKCHYCTKKLKAYTVNLDWENRTLHKKCYKKIGTQMQYDREIEEFEHEIKVHNLLKNL